MGSKRIARPGSSVLGRKVWGRPIYVARSQWFRSVIPEPIRGLCTDGSSVPVSSTDFSPTESLLATGSYDSQVRICRFRYPPEFSLALICFLSVLGKYTTVS